MVIKSRLMSQSLHGGPDAPPLVWGPILVPSVISVLGVQAALVAYEKKKAYFLDI